MKRIDYVAEYEVGKLELWEAVVKVKQAQAQCLFAIPFDPQHLDDLCEQRIKLQSIIEFVYLEAHGCF